MNLGNAKAPNSRRRRCSVGLSVCPTRRLRIESLESRNLLTAGSLDPTFSGDGIALADFGIPVNDKEANAVLVQTDGKVVVGGTANTGPNYDFALARFNIDGSLDTGFSGDGLQTTDFGNCCDEVRGMALQQDDKIVAVGRDTSTTTANFILARYNTNGSLDTSFDTDGKATKDFSGTEDQGNAVAMQFHAGQWKIVVAGASMQG